MDKPDPIDLAEKQFIVQKSNPIPENALDFNMQMLDPIWGKGEKISPELVAKLKQTKFFKDLASNEESSSTEDLWALLGTYTRDLRLGNLDKDEILVCEHYLNHAEDCLKEGFINAFVVSLSRVATRVELSQSKFGFLRRRPNTLETSKTEQTLEPKRKGLWNGGGK